jgi:hypothetical protein
MAGLAGVAGSLACTVAMTAALAGALSAAAASGARATAPDSISGIAVPGGLLGFLIEFGPQILPASALLVTTGLARRLLAAVPTAAAGAPLWWGMYGQASVAVMHARLVLAYAAWIATRLWTRRRPHPATTTSSSPS